MNRDTIVTLNDLTSAASVENVCENINKYEAAELLEKMAMQYRISLRKGGGSVSMIDLIDLIGDGIPVRELEAWLLSNV